MNKKQQQQQPTKQRKTTIVCSLDKRNTSSRGIESKEHALPT